jgi:hypothetical protein
MKFAVNLLIILAVFVNTASAQSEVILKSDGSTPSRMLLTYPSADPASRFVSRRYTGSVSDFFNAEQLSMSGQFDGNLQSMADIPSGLSFQFQNADPVSSTVNGGIASAVMSGGTFTLNNGGTVLINGTLLDPGELFGNPLHPPITPGTSEALLPYNTDKFIYYTSNFAFSGGILGSSLCSYGKIIIRMTNPSSCVVASKRCIMGSTGLFDIYGSNQFNAFMADIYDIQIERRDLICGQVVPTNTPTSTPTNTKTNTPTNTPVTPTNTPTNTATNTRTNTPTNTPITPTNTPTNTRTNTPTNTPVTPTNTPTATSTFTKTLSITPTSTPSATNTTTPTITLTSTVTPTSTQTPITEIVCKTSSSDVPYSAKCENPRTTIKLDGSFSHDTGGKPLTYNWATDCNGIIAEPDHAMTTISFSDPAAGISVKCSVTLTLSEAGKTINCATSISITPCINECDTREITGSQIVVDSSSFKIADIAKRLAALLVKTKGSSEQKRADKIKKEAASLHNNIWQQIWSVPSFILNCSGTSVCSDSDLSVKLNKIASSSESLLKLVNNAASRLVKISGKSVLANKLIIKAKSLNKAAIAELKSLPRSESICN